MHRISYRVALGGIITALCLFLMFLTGVMPLLYLALPMVAGALLLIIVEEIGSGWAVLTYAAVSLLSVFVTLPHPPAEAGEAAGQGTGFTGEMSDHRRLLCSGLLRHHLYTRTHGNFRGIFRAGQLCASGGLRPAAGYVSLLRLCAGGDASFLSELVQAENPGKTPINTCTVYPKDKGGN